jgi:hypothetical protein
MCVPQDEECVFRRMRNVCSYPSFSEQPSTKSKRLVIEAKETYYRGKRDLLLGQKRPVMGQKRPVPQQTSSDKGRFDLPKRRARG